MANANDAANLKVRPLPTEEESFLGSPGGVGYKPLGFGSQFVRGKASIFKGVFDFAVQGGATGNINLYDARYSPGKLAAADFVPLIIPYNFLICNVVIDVLTAPTSTGSATIALSSGVTAADLLAATAKASFTGTFAGIPEGAGTAIKVLNSITGSSGVIPYAAIAVAALTAGKFNVHFEGFLSD